MNIACLLVLTIADQIQSFYNQNGYLRQRRILIPSPGRQFYPAQESNNQHWKIASNLESEDDHSGMKYLDEEYRTNNNGRSSINIRDDNFEENKKDSIDKNNKLTDRDNTKSNNGDKENKYDIADKIVYKRSSVDGKPPDVNGQFSGIGNDTKHNKIPYKSSDKDDENDPNLSISLKQGVLKGRVMLTHKKNKIFAFWKIPYAKPPLGHLRFKEPQEPEKWYGVWDASSPGRECIQRNLYVRDSKVAGDEDCLYLNVFTPKISLPLLPVMVFIHGGGFISGSGNNHGPEYFLDKEVVLVTFNYRLGPLGFLSTGDAECPGNNGLKDQVAALKWVQENIGAFGGNPGRVTIFGESAGGASVHYHMLSPQSRGLFHRAISQSGTALCPWAMSSKEQSQRNAERLGQILKCPTNHTVDLINCLRRKAASEIVTTDVKFMEWSIHPMVPFRPVVEPNIGGNAFIGVSPLVLLNTSTTVQHVPWMIGINSEEGALVASRIFSDGLEEVFERDFFELAPMVLYYKETSRDTLDITRRLARFYFSEDDRITNNTIMQLVDLVTDSWFLRGIDKAVKLHSVVSTAPVYYYCFSYRGNTSFSSFYGDETREYGVSHQDELLYLFPCKELMKNITLTDNDDKMRENMTTLWTNFAKYGDPTPRDGVRWEPVSHSNIQFAELDLSGLLMTRGKVAGRATFWDSLKIDD
ncbi:esterase E4-like [Periplaneta americana]|uniref:esterase E4-like n=1 Tax=Periplaneta americana TaxID=6978 RepID=UPI0037E9A841